MSSPETAWLDLDDSKRRYKKSKAKKWLNSEAVQKMPPTWLAAVDQEGDVRSWLQTIGNMMEPTDGA